MKIKTILFAGLMLLATTIFAADDYSLWFHHKDVIINTTASGATVTGNVTGFPVLVRLGTGNFADFAVPGTKASLRFSRGSTHLPYQVERWDSTGGTVAEVWVLVDTVFGSDSSASHAIRMFWGKTGAVDSSNAAAVFTAANGYVGVWHLGDAAGISPRPNAVAGAPAAQPANDAGAFGGGAGTYVKQAGIIGFADTLRAGGSGTRQTPVATSDYLDIGSAPGATDGTYPGNNTYTGYSDFSTGFTYSLWLKPGVNTTSYTYMLELSNGDAATDNIQFFRPTTTTTYRYENVNGGTSGGTKSTATGSMVLGTWQHIVVTVGTGATPAVTIYKNGVVSLATSNVTQPLSTVLRANAWIGKSNYDGDGYFSGTFDEPEISNVARSANWIKLSYETQKTGSPDLTFSATVDAAPSGLAYTPNPAVYTVGYAIPASSPTVGGNATHYSAASLPAGLSIDTNTGVISGTPTTPSAATNYTVTASNSQGSTPVQLNITVNAALAAPTALSYSTPSAVYAINSAIPNNVPTITGTATHYSVSSLPAGLHIDSVTGIISGTATAASAAANYTVTASNTSGSVAATVNITVLAAPSGLSYATAIANYPKSVVIASNFPTVTGTVTTYSVTPALPAGLSLNSSTGAISGTPSAVQAATSYIVTAGNIAGTTTASVSIAIFGPPSNLLYAANPVTYTLNQPITANTVTYVGTVTHFSVAPALPTGLKLDTLTGTISGTPTATAASASYTVTASNAAGSTTFILTLAVPVSIAKVSLGNLFVIQVSGQSKISFHVPADASRVQFSILDMQGHGIWTRTAGSVKSEADRILVWDGTANSSSRAAAGLYIVRAKISSANQKSSRTLEEKFNYIP